MAIGFLELFMLAGILLVILPILFLFAPVAIKAGFSGWWAILLFVPFLNVVIIWLFAFIDWPVEKSYE